MDEAGEGAPSPAPHPNRQTQTSKAEVSTWLRTGTFYLALTERGAGGHFEIAALLRRPRSSRAGTVQIEFQQKAGPSTALGMTQWVRNQFNNCHLERRDGTRLRVPFRSRKTCGCRRRECAGAMLSLRGILREADYPKLLTVQPPRNPATR